MKDEDGTEKRPYRMGARAEAAAATGERILDATEALFYERSFEEVTLGAIAERAGVTVQTVLRRFGDRKGLSRAALLRLAARVDRKRGSASPGDVEGAVRVLVDHYEEVGDGVLRLLAEEQRRPSLRTLVDMGRDYHREWCERVFAPALEARRGVERERRLGQIVAVTDIYVWKLLRRDRGLSRRQTELALRELL
ncbi:MAG TPA: helix-turn-helix domain-containing protein, partial [Solirubrobacterales bacterium]